MDTFEVYWQMLEAENKGHYIQEILKYRNNSTGQTISTKTIEFLSDCLQNHTYPTVQILNLLPLNEQISQLFFNELDRHINLLLNHDNNTQNQKQYNEFYNLLTNCNLTTAHMTHIVANVFPKIVQLIDKCSESSSICLCLLGNSDQRLIENFLLYGKEHLPKITIDPTVIYHKALSKHEHFLSDLLQQSLVDVSVVSNQCFPDSVRDSLIITNLFYHFKSYIDDNRIEWILKEPERYATQKMRFLAHELNRIWMVYKFIFKNVTVDFDPLIRISSNYAILDMAIEYLNFDDTSSDLIRSLLQNNDRLNREIYQQSNGEDLSKLPNDLDIFEQYQILKQIVDIIRLVPTIENYAIKIEEKLKKCKESIRRIDQLAALIELFELIIRLFFLRWEHFLSNDLDRTIESGSESETEPNRRRQRSTERSGFILNSIALQYILTMLRDVLTLKKHSEQYIVNDNTTIRDDFKRIYKQIGDIQWRLSIIVQKSPESRHLIIDYRPLIAQKYITSEQDVTKNLDDDEPERIVNSITTSTSRRYNRQPKRSSFYRGSDGDRSVSISQSTDAEPKRFGDGLMKSISQTNDRRGDSLISQIFGTPDAMVVSCWKNGNIDEAKQIITKFNLEHTVIADELQFSDRFIEIIEKLRDIFQKYEQQEAKRTVGNNSNLESTVERIYNVAAIGFEAFKITNMLEAFAVDSELQPPVDVSELIEKHENKYKFLNTFNGKTLQSTLVTDLTIQLATNYDICLNICHMMTKLWNPNGEYDSLTIGHFSFMKNLLECLNLYRSITNRSIGIVDLICKTNYTLKADQMSKELHQERTFNKLKAITIIELDTIQKLKTYTKDFDELKAEGTINYLVHLIGTMQNLQRLTQLRDSNKTEQIPQQLLEIDCQQLIGELIFERSIHPIDIECIVSNLNLNLVHVICLNLCSTINGPTATVNRQNFNKINVLLEDIIHLVVDDISVAANQTKNHFKLNQNPTTLDYIRKHSPLIVYLLKKIHAFPMNDSKGLNFEVFENLLRLAAVKALAKLYGDNTVISALYFDHIDLIDFRDFIIRTKDYGASLMILRNLKQLQYLSNKHNFDKLNDELILKTFNPVEDPLLIEHITDIERQAECLLMHIEKIESSETVTRLIKNILTHSNVDRLSIPYQVLLQKWLYNVNVYVDISRKMSNEPGWLDVMAISIESPEVIVELLINDYGDLCLEWSTIYPLNQFTNKIENLLDIFSKTIQNRLPDPVTNSNLFKLIESLRIADVCRLYDSLIKQLKCVYLVRYLVDYLTKHVRSISYFKYEISLSILEQLTSEEQNKLWILFGDPLLIIEQFLMNTKFEILNKILQEISPNLPTDPICQICIDRHRTDEKSETTKSYSQYSPKRKKTQPIKDHRLTRACIDSLLRVYGGKSLDFRISETHSSTDIMSDELTSLDSLCGAFTMPKVPPHRSDWIRDDEATHCMRCRRSVFTMLTRRHHCRRCGRVVCHACSTKRMIVASLYDSVPVRVCDDCHKQTELLEQRKIQLEKRLFDKNKMFDPTEMIDSNRNDEDNAIESNSNFLEYCTNEWQFSGHVKHDQLLRDEFCYEYAPSVSLCLSILALHRSDNECSKFLLYQCQKFENLLKPLQPGYANPEIDYTLVTRMIRSLALAAKVRGDTSANFDEIREHAEIIHAVIQNGCETILPMDPPNRSSLQKLRDSLVIAENWPLALDISMKCGFSTNGVMAAWGIGCLRAGCFDTAREKFSHCLTKITNDEEQFRLMTILSYDSPPSDIAALTADILPIKRPPKSSPLIVEITTILESTSHPTHPEAIARASVIKNSNSSLASIRSTTTRGPLPLHEPAVNILHTLANLKNITNGKYGSMDLESSGYGSTSSGSGYFSTSIVQKRLSKTFDFERLKPNSRFFDECLYYLTNYGSHCDILRFLCKHKQTSTALKYILLQKCDPDNFVEIVYMPNLRAGTIDTIINVMLEIDETMVVWTDYIIHTCRYLELKGALNCLYQLQLLLKDPVRASMTCVKFYSMNCTTYVQLQSNTYHLLNAQKHLQAELEFCQWEDIKLTTTATAEQRQRKSADRSRFDNSLVMKMDSKTLNNHINTILRQMEVTKFLAAHEEDNRETVQLLSKVCLEPSTKIPTLFGNISEKIELAVLVLISGKNIEEGFGLTYRIIQDFNLQMQKVYGLTAKYLVATNRLSDIEKLIECIRSSNSESDMDVQFSNEILMQSIQRTCGLYGGQQQRMQIERLCTLITDTSSKIQCHIIAGQLKAAYLLAIKYDRIGDIRKILRHAEQTGQQHIKRLCEKKLDITNDC